MLLSTSSTNAAQKRCLSVYTVCGWRSCSKIRHCAYDYIRISTAHIEYYALSYSYWYLPNAELFLPKLLTHTHTLTCRYLIPVNICLRVQVLHWCFTHTHTRWCDLRHRVTSCCWKKNMNKTSQCNWTPEHYGGGHLGQLGSLFPLSGNLLSFCLLLGKLDMTWIW